MDKIDLHGKFATGSIKIKSDLRATSNVNPATGIHGAIDGSIHYSNAAMTDKGKKSGMYTIELDDSYNIVALAIALKTGEPETARIYLSNDGQHWGSPVARFNNAVHYTTDYIEMRPGTEAPIIISGNATDYNLGKVASRAAKYRFSIASVNKGGQTSEITSSEEVVVDGN